MASNLEFVEFVIEQMSGEIPITYKRMFGEFGLYYKDKYFAAVCDNRLLVKITEKAKQLMPNYKTDIPYDGAKPMFLIDDLDNRELLIQLATITYQELPTPKPRNRKIKTK